MAESYVPHITLTRALGPGEASMRAVGDGLRTAHRVARRPFVAEILPLTVPQVLTEGHEKVTLFVVAGLVRPALTNRAVVSKLSICAVSCPAQTPRGPPGGPRSVSLNSTQRRQCRQAAPPAAPCLE